VKEIFDTVSKACSQKVTHTYSTSFSLATRMLAPSIRQDIYNIYGFVRFADEIVDSFHDYDKSVLFGRFEQALEDALRDKISLNPILNSFQHTVHHYNIDRHLIDSFMDSMRLDLSKSEYLTTEEYKQYIYGSADVVGLMCLKVFVKGNEAKYEALKDSAMALGSAFQKVNFLRDLKDDTQNLHRSYFPHIEGTFMDAEAKEKIIAEIRQDFDDAYQGILKLPMEAKFGVYTAYIYYKKLLVKLTRTDAEKILEQRIRISNPMKMFLLTKSFVSYKLNML